jgi:hypothetical protein
MGIKIAESSTLEWHYLPTKFHENLPSGSKDIHTWFVLKTSKTLRTFVPYSKQLSLVAMVTSQPLCRFCPTVNYMHWLPQ